MISYLMYYYKNYIKLFMTYCTTDLHKLVKAAVTISILSMVVISLSVGFLIKLIGRGPARMVYFFLNCPITLST